MNKQERAALIQHILDKLFPEVSPPLQHTSPFTLLVAVVLSARSTDKRVNQVTPALFKLASTPQQMANLSVETIQAMIKVCGLSAFKARSLKELSRILLEKYDGQVPHTFEELEELPGVGHKTASVVMAQAFAIPTFPVDTHIHRCARRWGLSEGRSVKQTEKDLKSIFPEKDWIKLHLQIIYFARRYCTARMHKLLECPICKHLV